jgi:putative membrane protein
MPEHKVLLEAEFNPRVRTYWMLSWIIGLTLSVVGIPLLPIWLAIGYYVTARYLSHMRCVLTERSLNVNKGWLHRIEKTVPLDKITDVGLAHGPIMRFFNIEALTVETAGQSATAGPLVKLAGVVDARGFRKAVLQQRDAIVAASSESKAALPAGGGLLDEPDSQEVLLSIRDSLRRIEQLMGTRREI